ncbi:MAG: STAS domain-containing protein [Anaerolineae bacterium]|nr:STAS domain-containing protein [Anaerolineae bacterium]MCB0252405.1 STAS domain-containing protein [Anaerolineae bacterium]
MSDPVPTIEQKQLDRCDLFILHGRIDSSKAPEVEAAFKSVTDQGRYRFVLDMSDVPFVSSAFLRVLMTNHKQAKRFNRGNIYLAAMSPKITDVLELAGVLGMFQTYESATEAVGAW